MLAKSNLTCAACLEMQKQLEDNPGLGAKTVTCFAGLCETAVPVRAGDKVIGYLQTGQVAMRKPSPVQFSKITQQLLDWGIDLASLEDAYYHSRTLSPQQYSAMVKVLEVFAGHPSTLANQLIVQQDEAESPLIRRARAYILANQADPIDLDKVAHALRVSTFYFCKMFKKATGLTLPGTQGAELARRRDMREVHNGKRIPALVRGKNANYDFGVRSTVILLIMKTLSLLLKTDGNIADLLVRLVLGGIFFAHGAQLSLGWFGGYGFSGTMGFFTGTLHIPAPLAFLVIVSQFGGGIALILGLLTRLAALGIAANMLVAVAMVHAQFGFFMNWFGNQKGEGYEYHLLAIATAIVLVIRGGGKWAVDTVIAESLQRAEDAQAPIGSRLA
jgi:uncharacterized membrane protein YphA (DoxX/SURF4 family)